ncbi:hypothetical protein L484_002088 [Morus notabilis]|uniref:Uncharacterized protein n=1 Tax=Morus notabilis TaxID=981085 RepID=W9RXU8_9ROSA|nr:hypothetical protein L484_013356 [Morus notabilis]EXC31243.1 hypothetical protein L484_002088 [Morus notabilis]
MAKNHKYPTNYSPQITNHKLTRDGQALIHESTQPPNLGVLWYEGWSEEMIERVGRMENVKNE